MPDITCDVCFHHCLIKDNGVGFCGARGNVDGVNTCLNYGMVTSLAIDPIEKKPLAMFHPGSWIVSIGSFGCNLSCPFCQNHAISMDRQGKRAQYISPEQLCDYVKQRTDSIGIAFTYNEPLISWEYILACAKNLEGSGKKIVLVSNGTCQPHILEKLMPYVDAMNIDLKGDDAFYKELSGDAQTVRNTIAYVYDKCHLEVTTLVIPGKNDTVEFIEETSRFLASLDENIVLHLTRYFPQYKYTIPPTDKEHLLHLCDIARKLLKHVKPGNIW